MADASTKPTADEIEAVTNPEAEAIVANATETAPWLSLTPATPEAAVAAAASAGQTSTVETYHRNYRGGQGGGEGGRRY